MSGVIAHGHCIEVFMSSYEAYSRLQGLGRTLELANESGYVDVESRYHLGVQWLKNVVIIMHISINYTYFQNVHREVIIHYGGEH